MRVRLINIGIGRGVSRTVEVEDETDLLYQLNRNLPASKGIMIDWHEGRKQGAVIADGRPAGSVQVIK